MTAAAKPTAAERRAAEKEATRRRRVVHGWAFQDWTDEEVAAIRAYTNGGPVPPRFAQLDKTVTL
jgi:hypothetical protein